MEAVALLIIDIQKALFKKKNKIFNEDLIIKNINLLIDKACKNNITIIFVRHSNNSFLLENSEDWNIHDGLKASSEAIFYNKKHSSLFHEKYIVEDLIKRGINSFIITGLVTHGCVQAACMDAKKLGYEVILVKDAHSNFNNHPEKLIDEWNERLSNEGIKVLQTTEILEVI